MNTVAKMRVYEIARDIGIPNKDLISKIRALGLEGAASTFDVKFYKEKPDDEIEVFDCQSLASDKQKQKMREALERMEAHAEEEG